MNNLSYFLDTCPNYIKNNFIKYIFSKSKNIYKFKIFKEEEGYIIKNLTN